MLKMPTVFVVGAGASYPYGLPLGVDLIRQGKQLTHELMPALVEVSEQSGSDVAAFCRRLERYPGDSIDRFLENNTDLRDLGHLLIAILMGRAIDRLSRENIKQTPGEDWMMRVFSAMARGTRNAAEFHESAQQVCFVTFNFDSLIESRARTVLPRFWVPDNSEAPTLDVIHVHGRLPEPVSLDRASPWMSKAAKAVKVIHDELDHGVVEAAQNRIRAAKVVCFLGFDYAPENLKTLGVPDVIRSPDSLFGSAKNLSAGKVAEVRRLFGVYHARLNLAHDSFNNLQTLDQFDVLRT